MQTNFHLLLSIFRQHGHDTVTRITLLNRYQANSRQQNMALLSELILHCSCRWQVRLQWHRIGHMFCLLRYVMLFVCGK